MTENLTRAFKELLNQERFGSQSEIVDALKNKALLVLINQKYQECSANLARFAPVIPKWKWSIAYQMN
ncbi:malate dehydrogenase [Haemophilus influenzae 22.4-21]|uniref:Malate dehydrogenase n=1 Tax=Haemophilus influenzae 22.4-21 TaxID=375063 RepID=A4NXZ1_HAEIF|nr:malate dehydrogenase [Haemophilus influenzae 22.4-21]